MKRLYSKKYGRRHGRFVRQTRVINSLPPQRNLILLYHRLRSTRVTGPIFPNSHLREPSHNESCNSMKKISNHSLQEIDWQKLTNFPRVCVNSLHSNLLIEIVSWSDWCLLSSIFVVLEEENLEVCSAHTICVAKKVFYTILVKVLETSEIDSEGLRTKLHLVAAEKSEGTHLSVEARDI
ncbi:uncharacterized protein LOC131048802 isoform X2 [Cryptomeria japonica]|uniref:uncharacterized protein LOC131048802 isoform X2 n=1 Tax=Cryptomeria japonica TaxID=3369 RepID=UPI0025AC6E79|nr:uncharacterized protein LOC131048802 isoform X2 [Cryptomeria japonica]